LIPQEVKIAVASIITKVAMNDLKATPGIGTPRPSAEHAWPGTHRKGAIIPKLDVAWANPIFVTLSCISTLRMLYTLCIKAVPKITLSEPGGSSPESAKKHFPMSYEDSVRSSPGIRRAAEGISM